MIVASIIIGFIILFAITIFYSNITVLINYAHKVDDDHLYIQLSMWKFIKYKITVPMVKIEEDSPNIVYEKSTNTGEKDESKITPDDITDRLSDFKELIQHVFGLRIILLKFFRSIQIVQLEWHSMIGLKDAALTGKLTGVAWMMKGLILGVLSNNMKLMVEPKITIDPSFQIPISQTSLLCMFKIRIGNAILAGFKILKFWKGGRPSFKKKPLSSISKDKTEQTV